MPKNYCWYYDGAVNTNKTVCCYFLFSTKPFKNTSMSFM